MRILRFGKKLLYILYIASVFACSNDITNPEPGSFDSEIFQAGLLVRNSDIVNSQVNSLTIGLTPQHTVGDPLGHRENLKELIERVNSGSSQITADLLCYACIETYPPQSEIIVRVDSSGTIVDRILDIHTSEDKILVCVGIH